MHKEDGDSLVNDVIFINPILEQVFLQLSMRIANYTSCSTRRRPLPVPCIQVAACVRRRPNCDQCTMQLGVRRTARSVRTPHSLLAERLVALLACTELTLSGTKVSPFDVDDICSTREIEMARRPHGFHSISILGSIAMDVLPMEWLLSHVSMIQPVLNYI